MRSLAAVVVGVLGCVTLGSGTAQATSFAYVTNADADTVSVIDTDTGSVIKTINGFGHPIGVGINPSGTRVYVGNLGSGTVSIVDAFTNTILTTIPVGIFPNAFPGGIVFHPTLPLAYVTAGYDQVTIIDTSTNTAVGSIPLTNGGGVVTMGLAINPSGSRLYVTQPGNNLLNVLDTTTNSQVTTLALPVGRGVAMNPAGTRVYTRGLAGFFDEEIEVIDTATNTPLTPIAIAPDCVGVLELAISASGTRLYVACANSSRIAVIDTVGGTMLTTIPVGFVPFSVSLTPDDSRLYVANTVDNTVSIIDTGSNSVLTTFPVDDEPQPMGDFIGPDFVCGDGTVNPGEECDDGNIVGGDACSPTCRLSCGNAVVGAKLQITKLNTPPGDDRVVFKGQITLPGAPPLNPLTDGFRIVIKNASGTSLLDTTIAGGAYASPPGYGWRVNGGVTKWTYKTTVSSPPGNVFKAAVVKKYAKAPGLMKFMVQVGNQSLPLTVADLPLSGFLILDPAAPAGKCGQATFNGVTAACLFNGSASAVKCH